MMAVHLSVKIIFFLSWSRIIGFDRNSLNKENLFPLSAYAAIDSAKSIPIKGQGKNPLRERLTIRNS